MSLPVSQYEALLAEVRGLRRKAQRVQQLATPLITLNTRDTTLLSTTPKTTTCSSTSYHNDDLLNLFSNRTMDSILMERQLNQSSNYEEVPDSAEGDICSDDECIPHMSNSETRGVSSLYHGTWPVTETTMWNSEPTPGLNRPSPSVQIQEVPSVMSFASSSGGMVIDRVLNSPLSCLSRRSSSQQQLEAKVDMVYSLLAMLGGQEHADMGETLLALSTNPESCLAMRQSGCIPLLVQLVQSDKDADTRMKATQALNNLINSHPDEKIKKREIRIFNLLEQIRAYTDAIRNNREIDMKFVSLSSDASSSTGGSNDNNDDDDKHPVQIVAHLMKLSFDEGHRQAICQLGGIHTIASLVEVEHVKHTSTTEEPHCILLRRYACMALTNLTFGDSGNKALLCSFREFMRALVIQLQNSSDELRQVTASVLRNLSWRADSISKEILREVGSVTGLMKAAMLDNKENTLKSILSALWNLSAHCTENKSEICSVENALGFLVDLLTYKTPSKSLAIIENSGGILRNTSSQIAVRDDYRDILRKHNCLQILLDQLKSPSLTIVSNACGTLWNLSAKCEQDQQLLWEMGAPAMLRSLNHSKHKMIAMGSSAALKNLLSARPAQVISPPMDSTALAMDLPTLPTLGARKQKALLQDLDQNLSETYENIEKDSPVKVKEQKQFYDSSNSDYLQFASLNKPSTSYSNDQIPCSSLPYKSGAIKRNSTAIPVRNKCDDNSYLRNKPKSIAKNFCKSSTNTNNIEEFSESDDNNDKLLFDKVKIKEISGVVDEKDHCSIEDVSDVDNNQKGFDSSLELLKSKELSSVDGNLINFEDNSHSSGLSMDEECTNEKQDYEKEKLDLGPASSGKQNNWSCQSKMAQTKIPNSGIPLPKSSPKPIQSSQKYDSGIDDSSLPLESDEEKPKKSSALLRCNFHTSTQFKFNSTTMNKGIVTIKREKSSETMKMQNINRKADTVPSSSLSENSGKQCLKADSLQTNKESSSENLSTTKQELSEISIDKSQSKTGSFDDNSNSSLTNSDNFIKPDIIDSRLERSCEETNRLDNRMLDPDAMIESLDRFTAELVSQASHLQKTDDKYKLSTNDNTWNEDNSTDFPSMSGSAPNVITFEEERKIEQKSNDFPSMNTNTMTDSTLIALEATKIASAFKSEALMHSITGVPSLELDQIQPPSNLNSMCSSAEKFLKSPKLVSRKKSLPAGLMVRRALNLHASSLDSLSNLDQMNPPSLLAEVMDMEGSLNSVASLPSSENIKIDFHINGAVNRHVLTSKFNCQDSNVSDLENVNPPSIFNEITDLCNSLADIASEAISTDIFEDCCTHTIENPLQAEDDLTEFSDANSNTPLQSDVNSSSSETTPKRHHKNLPKQMTSKQRRNFNRDRYKTYTVAAEILMKEESIDDFKSIYETPTYTINSPINEQATYTVNSPLANDPQTYTIKALETSPVTSRPQPLVTETPPPTPQPSTYTINSPISECTLYAITNLTNSEHKVTETPPPTPVAETSCDSFQTADPETKQTSSPRSKFTIRKSFMQKRMENKDRFKTQVLSETNFSPDFSGNSDDLHFQANLVLKSLKDSKTDDLLDCETFSLVSDDSECNSGSPINYRTYHKNWGLKKNLPIINTGEINEPEIVQPIAKPKIIKPSQMEKKAEVEVEEQPVKGIRGRRKPLYSKTSTKVTPKPSVSNLVKNVTTTIRQKTMNKPPPIPQSRTSSGYGTKSNTPKTSPARGKSGLKPPQSKSLERQGTFTKEDLLKSKIATGSRIPAPKTKVPLITQKSASTDRTTSRSNIRIYNRSTSADSREVAPKKIQNSSSSQSLKMETKGAVKKSAIPSPGQRSSSNSNLNGASTAKKQVTSKIASLWKKIEESKKQQPKKDTRIWIQQESVGSSSLDNKDGVVMRNKTCNEDITKRVSRLGSFIVMDETDDGIKLQ